jgi:methylamine dehydrogenase accessory protein MauD
MSLWVASYITLWILTMVMALAIVALFRQLGLLHLRFGPRGALAGDEGPPLRAEAPRLIATDIAGGHYTVGEPGIRTTLVFVSPKCSVCELVLPAIKPIYRKLPEGSQLLVISDGDVQSTEEYAARLRGVPVIASPAIAEAYGVSATPFGVHVDARGLIADKGIINSLEQIESLVEASNVELESRSSDGARTASVREEVHSA